jgi:hypothetical protein
MSDALLGNLVLFSLTIIESSVYISGGKCRGDGITAYKKVESRYLLVAMNNQIYYHIDLYCMIRICLFLNVDHRDGCIALGYCSAARGSLA